MVDDAQGKLRLMSRLSLLGLQQSLHLWVEVPVQTIPFMETISTEQVQLPSTYLSC